MMKITALNTAFFVLSLGWALLTFGVFILFGDGVACIVAALPLIAISLIIFRGAIAQESSNG
jgi:hypothetical protein